MSGVLVSNVITVPAPADATERSTGSY